MSTKEKKSWRDQIDWEKLNERECRVLEFLAEGHSYEECGHKEGLSKQMISVIINKIREKLNAKVS